MTAAEHPLDSEDLMSYLDGELPSEQAAVVRAHLTACDACQRVIGELRGVSRDLARWQVEDAPATLSAPWPLPDTEAQAPWRFSWLRMPVMAPALVALVVIVLVGIERYVRNAESVMEQFDAPSSVMSPAPTAKEEPAATVMERHAFSSTVGEMSASSEASAGSSSFSASTPNAAAIQSAPTERPPSISASQIAFAMKAPAQAKATPSIARSASLRLSTRDLEATRLAVERISGGLGGWFSHVSVSRVEKARSLRGALQFPAASLDSALAALKPLGTVLEESQNGEDVTAQIIDVDVRVSNARNTEKRLLDLLQKRTGALDDVLAAEREIARVREEIERYDAHRKNLERRVTYATLNLEILEETQATLTLGPRPVPGRFRDAFVTGVTEALDTLLGLALVAVRVAPALLLWVAVLVWPVLTVVRRLRRRANVEPRTT